MQADPPDETKIPVGDAVGVTVVLLTCGYKGQEFVRVGYYVNNSYTDPELQENPPDTPQFDKVGFSAVYQLHSFSLFLFMSSRESKIDSGSFALVCIISLVMIGDIQ